MGRITVTVLVLGLALAGEAHGQGDPVPALIEKLKDKDVAVRIRAATALYELGPAAKDAIPALVESLQDESPVVRHRAVIAIGYVRSQPELAVPALRKALKDKRVLPKEEGSSISDAAISALGSYGPRAKNAIPDLMELATGEEYQPKVVAVGALGSIRSNPDQVIPLLQGILAGKNEGYLKAKAASSLAAYGPDRQSLDLFLKAFPCEDIDDPYRKGVVQSSLVLAVGKMGEHAKPEVGRLFAIFNDRKATYAPTVRDCALQALTTLGPVAKESIPALIDCLGPRSALIGENKFARALAAMGPEAVEALGRNLENPDPLARRSTADVLWEIGPKAAAAAPALEKALQDQNPKVRRAAGQALKKIQATPDQ